MKPFLDRAGTAARDASSPATAARPTVADARASLERLTAPAGSRLPCPRILVILAHPDDEVLALGGRMERLRESGFICVTDGAPMDGADASANGFTTRTAYSNARRAELEASLAMAQVPSRCARTLLLPGIRPAASTIVSQTLPDQGSAFHLLELTRQIAIEIRAFRPEAVLTHPYEGGHPDHDSCAFAVHTALRLLDAAETPLLLEAPFYHCSSVWQHGQAGIETGRFRPAAARPDDERSTPIVYDCPRKKAGASATGSSAS